MGSQVMMSLEEYNEMHGNLVLMANDLKELRDKQQVLKNLIADEIEECVNREYFSEGFVAVKDLYPLIEAKESYDKFIKVNRQMWELKHKDRTDEVTE